MPADFTVDPIANALVEAGIDVARPCVILCEGLAVYLDATVFERLLGELRQVAASGSRLAVSVSATGAGPALTARRAAFARGVRAMGETARTFYTAEQTDELLASTGWHAIPATDDRVRRAGFVVAE